MSKVTPLSVELDLATGERLAAVAAALHKPESWVVEQAVKDFIALQDWQVAAIDEGVWGADAGRVRGDAIELLRVMHGRQRWPDKL